MILYESTETAFLSNGIAVLTQHVFDDLVTEELNGVFKLEFTYPMFAPNAKDLTFDRIVMASTPQGDEPFFIAKAINKDGYLSVTCYHLFYRNTWNFIEDINIVGLGGQAALVRVLEGTGFTGIANTTKTANIRIVRYNVVEAIMGTQDNTILSRIGGELERTKFTVNLRQRRGRTYSQNPVEIRYAKNLESYEAEIDYTTVATRVMPKGFDGLILPEKYVVRPGATAPYKTMMQDYETIKAVADLEDPKEDELPLADAYAAMRQAVLDDFETGAFDARVNYKVSFVDLSSTEEYKNKAILERLYLGDDVRVIHDDEDIDLIARVISYKWKPLTNEYEQIELGNFQQKFTDIQTKIDTIGGKLEEVASRESLTIEHVTNLLTNALGGYVKQVNGEMMIMDTEDPGTATKVWRWNLNGLGYSGTGINGPYETAITMDGNIVGKFITARSITANQLASDVGQTLDLSSNESITLKVADEVSEQIGEAPIYTWIKYADTDQGTNMADNPAGKTYLGLASGKTTDVESTDPEDYIWSLIQGPAGTDGLDGLDGEDGLPGPAGADGVSSYTHIAYATNSTGSEGFSTSDGAGKTYIGMYVDSTPADSTDPEDYTWTLIKGQDGANGIPGTPGIDGQTPYLHIAYATNSTGSTGFSTTDSTGKTYIGQYTDYTEADSTDPELYSWTLIKGQSLISSTIQYYRSTSNTTQTDGSWSDTPWSYVAGRYMWTRLKQVWENPADTTYTDPVLDPVWGKIHEHEASIQVNADNILSKVSQSTYDAKMGTFTGTVSEIKQTADAVKFSFENFQVGGENLIRHSHMLSDKFEAYQGSTITVARDNEPVPEWDTDTATVIQTSSLGTSTLKARWVISDNLTFMADKPMVFSVYAKNNRSDVAVTIGTNRIGAPITLAPLEMRKLEFIGVAPGNEGRFLILELTAPTEAYYLSVTLSHPKWELGEVATEWSPHPEEFYVGTTKVDRDGVEVGRSDSGINSKIYFDGLRIKDGENAIANFGETTYMPYANIDRIDSLDVVGTVREAISIEIGEGQTYTTVSEVLEVIFKGGRTTLLFDTDINLYLNGNITDEVILKGIEGNGRVYIWFRSEAKLYGRIWARDCKVRVYIRSEVTTGTGRGLIKNTTGAIQAIWNESSSYVNVISLNVDGGGKTHGIIGNDAGETSIQDCDISNCGNAITSNFGSDVRVMDCRGSSNSRSLRIQTNATMYVTGSYPDAGAPSALNLSGFYFPSGTPVAAPSTFSAPPVTDKTFTKIFAPTYLKTQTPNGEWSTYYGDRAAQNRWASTSPYSVGIVPFGAEVKTYIDDRKAGTTPTIQIRLRRSAASHGSSNAIPPDPNNFTPTGTFTGATHGGWSNWVTVPMSLFTASGFTFKFGTSKTDLNYNPYRYYAIWDACELKVTKTKAV